MSAPDVVVRHHGTLSSVGAHTPRADAWVEKNVRLEEYQRMAGEFMVEHRYIDNLVSGMRAAGLRVDERPHPR